MAFCLIRRLATHWFCPAKRTEIADAVKLGWIYDRRFLQHDTGRFHPECPDRLLAILEAVRQADLMHRLEPIEFHAATEEQLGLVHEPAYVHLVRLACDEGFEFIGSEDTRLCRWSFDVAALAAGGVLAACDAVVAERVPRVFCAVRPPGHHAEADRANGFCLFNHIALAAEYLVLRHGLQRVAIVDIDAHHGNGTQRIFESRSDVFYLSLHERPGSLAFPGTGEADEVGLGAGRNWTLNVPMDRGSGETQYRAAFEKLVVPALNAYRPDIILISAGFDALAWDRTSHLSLPPEAFGWMTRSLVAVAERFAKGRIVSVLEGGYNLNLLGSAVCWHLRSLLSRA
jgi:acetoin utilization deacetylase AcuC-like enzyme